MRASSVRSPTPFPSTAATVIGLVAIAAYVLGLLILIGTTTYSIWGAVIVTPLLIAFTIPALRRQASREGDARTFRLLLIALIVKLSGAILRYVAAFALYGGTADASMYNNWGVRVAQSIRHGHMAGGLHSFSGTDFIRWLTGAVYALIGPTKIGGFVFFSWLGFLGLFLFYRAFTIAVPQGRRRSYAHLLFFLPSLVYWPSSIGKEAWMMFALGIAVYGIARILKGEMWRGLVFCLPGLWLAWIVRPHIAALLAVSLAAAVVTRKSKSELRELAPIVKGGSVVAIMILAGFLVVHTDRFLQKSGIDTSAGVTSALTDVQSRTSEGGASFVPSIVNSPVRAPLAAVTVLFRPFYWEFYYGPFWQLSRAPLWWSYV